jgi:hypothetical protein
MNPKKYLSLAIVIVILIAVLSYGDDAADRIFNEWNAKDESATKEYSETIDNIFYLNILSIIIGGVCIFIFIICLGKAFKQEKKKEMETVRNIIRSEFDARNASAPKMENCANCGKDIGKLEKRYMFENHLVCGECDQKLKNQK